MVQRCRQEADPLEAFLCGQQQATPEPSRVQAKAQYIRGWETRWDRLADENGSPGQSSPKDATSPRRDSLLLERIYGEGDTHRSGTRRGLRGCHGSASPWTGSNYGPNALHGGGSRQDDDSTQGTLGSLHVEHRSREAAPRQVYDGALPRQSKSS